MDHHLQFLAWVLADLLLVLALGGLGSLLVWLLVDHPRRRKGPPGP